MHHDPLTGLPLTNSHNVRSAQLNFYIPHAGVLHGLAGYFEAVLYRDVGLSIHPDRKDRISPNMLSWFPLFFPLKVGTGASHGLHILIVDRSRFTCREILSFLSQYGA